MELLIVRHGDPDYANDTLTEKGKVEAELLAEKLSKMKIDACYVSPLGRARDTARYTLDKINQKAEVLDWLHEFRGRQVLEDGTKRRCWEQLPSVWANEEIYYTDPSEKIAYAMSYRNLVLYLFNYPNFKNKYLKEYISVFNKYIDNLQYGYRKLDNGKYNIPLVHFLSATKKMSHLKDVGFKLVKKGEAKNISKIGLDDKFMYGFPITEEEMKTLESRKIIIKKRNKF